MSSNDQTILGGSDDWHALPPGTMLDNYRIERPLGRGGMGAVYLAEHVRLGKQYAVKVLPAELSGDVRFQERFGAECRNMASLEHPGIVTVHNAGESNGLHYLAMEYLEGGDLGVAMKGRQNLLGEVEVQSVLRQILEALAYAHGKGVIHRDLKPANLLLSGTSLAPSLWRVKIGDFGIAQVLGADYMRTMVERTVAATRMGNAETIVESSRSGSPGSSAGYVGTVHYMAPEVLAGGEHSFQSDLYAVGVMAYEWLTGRKPVGLLKPVSKLCPYLSANWDSWLGGMLEYESTDRYANANDCLEALDTIWNEIFLEDNQEDPELTASNMPDVEPNRGGERALSPPPDWTLQLAGDVSLEMQWIPPGEFVMGSPERVTEGGFLGLGGRIVQEAEPGRWHDEGPQTRVRLTQGYWLGKTPVTQGQWQELMENNPSHFKNSGFDAPVEMVSWTDAMEFCRRLTERERSAGRLHEGYEYTLPSEAQWEYGARSGTTTRWSFGENERELRNYAWFSENSGNRTHPVGQKRANAWGLYDVHGNVREWTRSWHGSFPGGSVADYEGPGWGSNRVSRGGSWFYSSQNTRSACRIRNAPDYRSSSLGFRLALSSVR